MRSHGCFEEAWNNLVYTPIFCLTFASHPAIRVDFGTSAEITSSFVPTIEGIAAEFEVKMTTFDILLWLNEGWSWVIYSAEPENDFYRKHGLESTHRDAVHQSNRLPTTMLCSCCGLHRNKLSNARNPAKASTVALCSIMV
jgi:hypothetical protein